MANEILNPGGYSVRNAGKSGAEVKCGGMSRHWYTGPVKLKLPFCIRCGATRPRPLSADDLEEARIYIAGRQSNRMQYLLERSTEG